MHATVQPTIGEVPDAVWTMIEPIPDERYPAKPQGHRRVVLRRVPKGIIFRLPMESAAPALGRRQHGAPAFPAVGPTRALGAPLGRDGRGV